MGSRYNNYPDSPEYNINQEEVFDTSPTSFKNL